LDKQATWCNSKAECWIYGHGTFSLSTHKNPVLGCFKWMKNSANEAKPLWLDTFYIKDQIDYLCMDSKADDYDLFHECNQIKTREFPSPDCSGFGFLGTKK